MTAVAISCQISLDNCEPVGGVQKLDFERL